MKKKIIKARILSNKKICADHFVMELDVPLLAKNSYPGQFVNVKIDNVPGQFLRIPLGIHSLKKKGISLLYKTVGEGTLQLSGKKKNDILDIMGPLGTGFDIDAGKSAILVSGGHGAAPLYALCEAMRRKNMRMDLYTGSSAKKHIVCPDKFAKLGAKVHIATDDGSKGFRGYVTELLESSLKRGPGSGVRGSAAIYACGPKPMLKEVARIAKKYKMPAQVSVDEYMACGIGVCLGCAIKTVNGYKMVCKDGPVFKAEDILW